MSKVKAELKTGATIEVYEGEKYRLWKKGLVVVDKKQQDKYEDKQANEPVVKMRKALEGTKTDRLNKRLEKLEKFKIPKSCISAPKVHSKGVSFTQQFSSTNGTI